MKKFFTLTFALLIGLSLVAGAQEYSQQKLSAAPSSPKLAEPVATASLYIIPEKNSDGTLVVKVGLITGKGSTINVDFGLSKVIIKAKVNDKTVEDKANVKFGEKNDKNPTSWKEYEEGYGYAFFPKIKFDELKGLEATIDYSIKSLKATAVFNK